VAIKSAPHQGRRGLGEHRERDRADRRGELGHTLIHEHRRERDQPNAGRLPHLYDDGAIITLVTDQGRAHAARGRNDEA